MDKPFVIFNPAARGEKAKQLLHFLSAIKPDEYTLARTTQAGDARRLAADAAAKGFRVIVAAGGDGTLNEVINGIAHTEVALGVLPLGTVNVFAREVEIPSQPDAAWRVITEGQTRLIDLARSESNGVTRHFVQLAGVGLDASAVRRASWSLKKKLGPLSYIWAGLQTLSHQPPAVEVHTNGEGVQGCGGVVLVGNGRFYGGSFCVFPKAQLDDGRLDVCIFENNGYLDVMRYAQGVWRGVHTQFRDVRYFQASKFVCNAAGGTPFEVDGEDAGDVPVTFSVVPRALRVIVPKSYGETHHA